MMIFACIILVLILASMVANMLVNMCVYDCLKIILKEMKMNQDKINRLTEELRAGNEATREAIAAEAAEIREAIDNTALDTTELEAAIAENAGLKEMVEGIYSPEAGEQPETPAEEQPAVTPDTTTVEGAPATDPAESTGESGELLVDGSPDPQPGTIENPEAYGDALAAGEIGELDNGGSTGEQ